MSVHWQDPDEPMYNQPACGETPIAPTTTSPGAVTCPVCRAIAATGDDPS